MADFGRRHRQDEEHEHLAVDVAEVARERDEVEIDREQHQLDAHQQHDDVLAVQEDAGHADANSTPDSSRTWASVIMVSSPACHLDDAHPVLRPHGDLRGDVLQLAAAGDGACVRMIAATMATSRMHGRQLERIQVVGCTATCPSALVLRVVRAGSGGAVAERGAAPGVCTHDHVADLGDDDEPRPPRPSGAYRVKPCAQLLDVDVEHHDDEQEQHHHGADVDQHQHDAEKLGLEQQPHARRC